MPEHTGKCCTQNTSPEVEYAMSACCEMNHYVVLGVVMALTGCRRRLSPSSWNTNSVRLTKVSPEIKVLLLSNNHNSPLSVKAKWAPSTSANQVAQTSTPVYQAAQTSANWPGRPRSCLRPQNPSGGESAGALDSSLRCSMKIKVICSPSISKSRTKKDSQWDRINETIRIPQIHQWNRCLHRKIKKRSPGKTVWNTSNLVSGKGQKKKIKANKHMTQAQWPRGFGHLWRW